MFLMKYFVIIVLVLIASVISDKWIDGYISCPQQCVCQYSHFMDLSIARWIHYVQSNRNDKIDMDSKEDDFLINNEALFEGDDSYLENPLIKQATCILQIETNRKDLFNSLPHDIQSLVILFPGGNGDNITVLTSELKPLNQLTTLEIRGSADHNLKLLIDEPLSFLQNANFDAIQLLGSENLKRPKNPVHPSESFDYMPNSEKIAYNISLETEAEIEILPYDIYIMEIKKSRMASFYGWDHLEVLRIHNCKLDELHWEMFDGLSQLQHLSLEQNDIKIIPAFALYGALHIKTLSLAHNKIFDLNYRSLAGLLELEVLDFSHNKLTKLSELSFPPFPKLEIVDFRFNPIRYIFPATFGVMNNTRLMFIGSNEMELELSGNIPFESLDLLRQLFIDNLTIPSLDQNIFKGLTNLEILNVKGQISRIDFDAFIDMKDLRELNLSNCHIREISMDSFMGCKNLEIIDLSHNYIKYIPPGLFDDQNGILEIYLNGNQLRFLPTNFFMKPSLKLARLTGNPWKCTCEMVFWKPKITNRYRGLKQERCVREFHSGKTISCRQIDNYKFDNKLSPRCANFKERSVFYALRKNLQCNIQKESVEKHLKVRTGAAGVKKGSKFKHLEERKERQKQQLNNNRNNLKMELHKNEETIWNHGMNNINNNMKHFKSLSFLSQEKLTENTQIDDVDQILNNI